MDTDSTRLFIFLLPVFYILSLVYKAYICLTKNLFKSEDKIPAAKLPALRVKRNYLLIIFIFAALLFSGAEPASEQITEVNDSRICCQAASLQHASVIKKAGPVNTFHLTEKRTVSLAQTSVIIINSDSLRLYFSRPPPLL